jgi:hypothetical protein
MIHSFRCDRTQNFLSIQLARDDAQASERKGGIVRAESSQRRK